MGLARWIVFKMLLRLAIDFIIPAIALIVMIRKIKIKK